MKVIKFLLEALSFFLCPLAMFLKKHIRTLLKASGYIITLLIIIRCVFYSQVIELLKDNTSFTSSLLRMDTFPLPSLILCIPGIKQYNADKYGYYSIMNIFRDGQERYKKYNKTPLQVFQELPYKIDEDFNVQFSLYQGKVFDLHLGKNFDDQEEVVDVHEVLTSSGLCYQIEPKFQHSIQESSWFELRIQPQKTLTSSEKDLDMHIFVASNNTWQGLYFFSWQYIDVPKLSIPFDTSLETLVEVTPVLIEFRGGIPDVAKCMEEIVMTIKCPKLCYPVAFNRLATIPDCQTFQDIDCMSLKGFWNATYESQFGKCVRPEKAMTYKARPILTRPAMLASKSKEIIIWMKYSTDQLEVKEEIPNLGLSSFLGETGGALGLFLGFSFYTYFSHFIDYLMENYWLK